MLWRIRVLVDLLSVSEYCKLAMSDLGVVVHSFSKIMVLFSRFLNRHLMLTSVPMYVTSVI
jgi:hypothetical protein